MIEFLCSNIECGYSKAVSEAHLGKRATCPKCKTVTRITDDEPVLDLKVVAEVITEVDAVSAQNAFDESRTFAYKGDFLGMTIEQFIRRHQSDNLSEFTMLWSDSLSADDFGNYGIDIWTKKEPRVRTCVAYGSRMTIVGVPLRLGLYQFLDGKLHSIATETQQETNEVYVDIFSGLVDALGEADESRDIANIWDTSTWIRPDGNLGSVSEYQHGRPLFVRYVNQLTLDEFNAVCNLNTDSEDSRDL